MIKEQGRESWPKEEFQNDKCRVLLALFNIEELDNHSFSIFIVIITSQTASYAHAKDDTEDRCVHGTIQRVAPKALISVLVKNDFYQSKQ